MDGWRRRQHQGAGQHSGNLTPDSFRQSGSRWSGRYAGPAAGLYVVDDRPRRRLGDQASFATGWRGVAGNPP